MESTIGERIGCIIDALHLKKVQFASDLKIDQSYVTQLIKGRSKPSKRLMDSICAQYNVNQYWLETGEGEMFIETTREEEISSFLADVQMDGGFKAKFIAGLTALDENDWKNLKTIFDKMIEKMADEK